MKFIGTRRCLSRLIPASMMVLAMFAGDARSQTPAWTSRPVTLVVTGAPGASTDLIARRLARIIGTQSGLNLVVENQGGASGSIALMSTIKAPPNGHRLVTAVPDSVTIYSMLKKIRPYQAEKDLTPIAQVAKECTGCSARSDWGN